MFIFYDTLNSNQVQALYSTNTNSAMWAAFTKVEVTNPDLVSQLKQHKRNCRVTIVDDEVTVVTPFDHPDDNALPLLKKDRVDATRERTDELYEEGFIYNGKVHSLGLESRLNWFAAGELGAQLNYPYYVFTLDGEPVSINSPGALNSFRTAAIGAAMAIQVAEGTLLAQIYGAVDKAALDAIIDTR